MGAARSKIARQSPLQRKRRAALRTSFASAFLIDAASLSGNVAAKVVPRKTKISGTVTGKPAHVEALIVTYGNTSERGHRAGRKVSFRVDIESGQTPIITPIKGSAASAGQPIPDAQAPELEMALARARERGRTRVAEILSDAKMLSADAFARLLGTTRVTVNAKRQKRQVLALEGAKRGFRFPEWQVGPDGKPFSALPELFDRFGDDPWAVYRFLVQSHTELDGLSGREALRRGMIEQVVEAAESVARAFA